MTDFRALCVELTDCLEKADWPNRYKQVFQFWVDIARAALAEEPAEPIPPAALPEGYIDPEHSGDDRALLQTFYSACLAEGGTADEITLRGLRAVLADEPAVPEGREPASVAGQPSDEELQEPLGDLIGKWCQEGMRVKPHGTSFPLAHYVASKAYQYGLRKGRPAPPPTDKEPTRLRNCPTHGQQPPWAWGCPECVRQLREELAALQQRHPATALPLPEVGQ